MILNIIKKTPLDSKLLIVLVFFLFSCQKDSEVIAKVYKEGKNIDLFYGEFYSTKHGGLNYFINNNEQRSTFFNLSDIDSISLNINGKEYTSKPIIDIPFSREINESDFNFFVDEKEHKIVVDTVKDMSTVLFFTSRTSVKKLKEMKLIEFTMIDK